MQFVITGFTQDMGFRVFTFEGIDADWARTAFIVRADLALARRYGIRLQELPLMCRGLLERFDPNEERRTVTFNEEDMRVYAVDCAAKKEAAALKRKPRRPPTENSETAGQPLGYIGIAARTV